MSAAARLDDLAEVVAHRRDLEQQIADADDKRDRLIRTLLADGARVADLVGITSLSRARIYQIRDRRR